MSMSQQVQSAVDHIPSPVQHGMNWGAVGAAVSSFFGAIQGPVAVIAGIVSTVWLGCQLWLFFKNKPWRKDR